MRKILKMILLFLHSPIVTFHFSRLFSSILGCIFNYIKVRYIGTFICVGLFQLAEEEFLLLVEIVEEIAASSPSSIRE